jgi:hypothetical protein
MKKIVEANVKEGLEALLGERAVLLCINYFYVGKLVEVNRTCVKLENSSIVYETGDWGAPTWKDAQSIGRKYWYVRTDCIESYGLENK